MANRRDYRRRTYIERIVAEGVGSFDEPEHDDQVLLVPGRINFEADDDDASVLERIRRAAPGYELDETEQGDRQPSKKKVFRLIARRGDAAEVGAAETAELVRSIIENDLSLLDVVAPEYVFLTQQKPHPGEDPELGLRPVVPDGRDHLGRGVRVLVVDTGLALGTTSGATCEPGHEDLLLGNGTLLGSAAGHGTFISALVKAVAPGASVDNVKVFNPMGWCEESQIADALLAAAQGPNPPHVINLSLGMHGLRVDVKPPGREDERITLPPVTLLRAVRDVHAILGPDVAIVASAGNSDSTDKMYPAAFKEVVGVAALECEGRRWPFSNHGDWVDASALGSRLRTEFVTGDEDPQFDPDGNAEHFEGQAEWSGTSFAAPIVAAQIAIVKAAGGLSAQLAQQIVLQSSCPAVDPGCGVWVRATIPGHT